MDGLAYQIQKDGQLLIFADNPRPEFTKLAKRITYALPTVGISKSSVIANSAKIGRDCYIGDCVVIGLPVLGKSTLLNLVAD